jgi:hypothetical protein
MATETRVTGPALPPGPENCTVATQLSGFAAHLHESRPYGRLQNTLVGKNHPSSPRPISTGLLNALLRVYSRPINLVVYQGSYSLEGMGELISRWASRLDAFSGYPVQT